MTSVDIPVMRGNEAAYITLDAECPREVMNHYRFTRYITVGSGSDTETMRVRQHLLMDRKSIALCIINTDTRIPMLSIGDATITAGYDGIEVCEGDAWSMGGSVSTGVIPWADVLKAVPSEALMAEIRRGDRYRDLVQVLIEKLRQKPYEASPDQFARHRAERSRDRALSTRCYLD